MAYWATQIHVNLSAPTLKESKALIIKAAKITAYNRAKKHRRKKVLSFQVVVHVTDYAHAATRLVVRVHV